MNWSWPLAGIRWRRGGALVWSTPAAAVASPWWPAILLFLILAVSTVSPGVASGMMIYFLGLVALWCLGTRRALPRELTVLGGVLLVMLFVGAIGSTQHRLYDVLKDIWYLVNPSVAFLTGYALAHNVRSPRPLLTAMVLVGVAFGGFQVYYFATHSSLLSLSASDIRAEVGHGFMSATLAVALLLVARRPGVAPFGHAWWLAGAALLVCLASVVLSFSRTLWLILLILLAAGFGWVSFASRRQVFVVLAVALAIVLLGLFAAPRELGSNPGLIDKLLYTLREMRVDEYRALSDVNTNWRGYETARALRTFRELPAWQWLTGDGFGATVDLGLYMRLAGEQIRFAPILHNGYAYLLVKTGLIGVVTYLLLVFGILRVGARLSRDSAAEIAFCGRMITGIAIIYLLTTFAIAGPFNKSVLTSVTVLLGILLGRAHVLARER